MEMFVAPSIHVPFGIRPMVGGQVRRQLRGVLASLQERLGERQRRADDEAAARREQWGQLWGGGGAQWRGPGAWLQERLSQPPWWMAVDLIAAA